MRSCQFVLTGLAILVVTAPGHARVEADPQKDYQVTPDIGPWMICTKSYVGEMAPKYAHDLVLELRSRYDLPAYVYNRGADERRKLQDQLEKQRREQENALRQAGLQPGMPLPVRHVRIEDQCAVLIGGFKDMESASKALEKIKKIPKEHAPTSVPADTLIVARPDAKVSGRSAVEKAPLNPFAASFVVHNPTVPEEKPTEPAGVDTYDVLKKLNAGETYSLLKCGKRWTLAIKEFRGPSIIQPKNTSPSIMEKLLGRSGDQLSASAMNAHNLAEALNKANFKAYVLHTRTSSVVCVGAFDKPDDHALETTRQALLNSLRLSAPGIGGQDPSGLMAQLLPMPVPQPDNSQFKDLVSGQR
jgi:hypothetical protein